MHKTRKNGMTLIEVLISVALFGLFGVLVVSLIVASIRNYSDGKLRQDLRQQTSGIINSIREDISKAYLPPTPFSGSWVPSGVILPNPYGVDSLATKDEGNGRSENRLIICILSLELDDPSLSLNDPVPHLRFVEYIVPDATPNRLFRRTYSFGHTSSGYDGFFRNVSMQWVVDDSYFIVGNVNQSVLLAELPGVNDRIEFVIQREPLISMDHAYNTTYDRHLFNINCRMTKYNRDDLNAPVTYQEQTKAKIKAE